MTYTATPPRVERLKSDVLTYPLDIIANYVSKQLISYQLFSRAIMRPADRARATRKAPPHPLFDGSIPRPAPGNSTFIFLYGGSCRKNCSNLESRAPAERVRIAKPQKGRGCGHE